MGRNFILDAAYIFQYVGRAIDEGQDVWKFNEDDFVYKPSEDPFDKPNKSIGEDRYDVLASPLPRRSERGQETALPTTAHFRKLSFYVRGGQVVRIEERIDFESHPDFLKAKRGEGPDYHLRLLEAVREGGTREPLRLRRMTYRFDKLGNLVKIALPEGALQAGLDNVLEGIAVASAPRESEESGQSGQEGGDSQGNPTTSP